MTLSFNDIERLIDGKFGEFRAVCPMCGSKRSTPHKRKLRVLKIWREKPDFASFACGHCGGGGYAVRDGAAKIDHRQYAQLKAEASQRTQDHAARQLEKARWLWSLRQPIAG